MGRLAKVFNGMIYQLKEKTSELEQLNRTLEERVQRGVAELRMRDEAEKQRLIGEMERAREVQMGLFPQSSRWDNWRGRPGCLERSGKSDRPPENELHQNYRPLVGIS